MKCIGEYEKLEEIGRGTYGSVYAGRHVKSKMQVAIKKLYGRHDQGEKEAEFLRQCADTNHILKLLEVVHRNNKTYLILEYMKSDLETILKAITEIPQIEMSHLKAFLLMLLKGVSELHARGIMHRDLKPNNLLLSKDKTLYICDFGMAKQIESNSNSTNHQHSLQVITRAYRPPEIFFGKQNYGVEVDMWSVGCVFAEMLLRQPFFDGNSDIDHLCMIFQKLGSPNECGWKKAEELPVFLKFKDTNPKPLGDQFKKQGLSAKGVDLLSKLLSVNPATRISAEEALKHEFFMEEPRPAPNADLPLIEPPERIKNRKKRLATAMSTATNNYQEDSSSAADDCEFIIKGRRIV